MNYINYKQKNMGSNNVTAMAGVFSPKNGLNTSEGFFGSFCFLFVQAFLRIIDSFVMTPN